MRFTLLTLVAGMAGLTAALPPITNSTYFEIGPLPYAELKAQVEALHASEKRSAGLSKRTTEGVYLCDGLNFSGDCYYGSYPIGDAIYPDPYWVVRLQSAGPDNYNSDGGGSNYCEFYGGPSCDDTAYAHDVFSYPGGNLGVGVADGLGCFFCD